MQSIIPAAGGDQIRLNLSYSSLSREGLPLNNAIDSGPMGGWEITDLQRLRVIEEDLLLMVEMSGHRRFGYLKQGDAFVTDAPSRGAIYRVPGGWSQRDAAGALVEFDTAGLLIRNTFPGGRSRSYGYLPDAQSRPQLSTISDRFGRSLQLFYDGQSRLASAIDAAGESYLLSYAPSGALSRVQYPDGSYREFLYETPSFPLLLTGVIDENGDLYASYGYNSLGLAISTERAGGADRKDIVYVSDVQAEVTERVDEGRTHSRTFGFSYVGFGLRRVTSLTQVPCEGCAGVTQMFAYDSRGVLTSATDAKGVETRYVRDFLGNELSRTDAYGTAEARTVSTIWDSNLRLPLQIEEPGRQTSYAYDTAGRLTSRTVRDTSTQESRTTSYTYNGAGLLQSVDGPRSDVPDITLYTYDTAGNLQTIVNALGQITTVAETNAFGRPLRIVDPNNVETTLTYDLRQRLKTQTVAGQTTRFDYDAAGLLTRVTQPDGATLDYRYDDAHRLFEVEDGNGNRMRYTLDALGNPKLTEALDSQGVVTRRSQRTYDRYGRLWKEIDSLNQAFVRQYDANGNDIAGTDPLSLTTQRAYDALNRLTQSTDPAQGVIQQAYDPRDQLVSVTDPRGLVTGYQRNAFGEILSQQSPDSGTTSYQYDAAGNLASRTDARGITLQYQYDALNRVVLEDAPGTGEDIVYRYDGSNYVGVIANGIGRLTGIVDGSGSRELRYDARGNLLTSKRSLGARTFITSYSYDAASRRSSITYPFGRRIEYARDTQGRVTSIRGVLNGNSVLLADQIVYEPWGAPRSWRLGNGLVVNRTSDLDGRIQRLTAGSLLDRSYTYDAKGRIVGIADGVRPNESQTFTYDPLDRLTTFYSQRWNQLSWGYDPTGNRTVDRVNGGSATHYEYETASNRLIRQTGDSPSIRNYDAAGNQRVQEIRPGAATTLTYTSTYNARGRIVQSVRTGYTPTPAVSFGYDSEGRRAFKGTTEQHYDESGQLLSDTRLNGVSKEYVWLDGLPIAVASRVVGGLTETASDPHRGLNWMYAVPDHLGTVQMLTNDQQAIVWRGAYEPFGRALLDSTNQTTLNLRLPGQYLDDETTTNQNWHREYDRQAGRYVQSDPIGLAGGVNTYAYVGGNPISFIDPEGLRGTIYRGTGDMAGQIWMGNQMRNGAIQNYDSLERRTDRYYGPQLRMTCLVSSCSIPQPANQCSVSNPSGAATQQTSGPVMSAPGQSGCTCMQSSLVLTGQ